MITYEVNLCIGSGKQDSGVAVKCHDTGVNLLAHMYTWHQGKWGSAKEPYMLPANATAVLKIAKPDKTYVLIDGTADATSAFFQLPPQSFTVPGTASAEVSVFDKEGRRITSATFGIEVPKECVCNCEMESEPYVDIMGKQIKAAKDAEAGAKEAAETAKQAQINVPKIGDNGNWLVWDLEKGEYVDTGVAASGTGMPDDMESTDNRVSSIDETADDDHYPTTQAVVVYVDGVVGDIESALDGIISIQESYIAQSPSPLSVEVTE